MESVSPLGPEAKPTDRAGFALHFTASGSFLHDNLMWELSVAGLSVPLGTGTG